MLRSAFRGIWKNYKVFFIAAGIIYLAVIILAFLWVKSLLLLCREEIELLVRRVAELIAEAREQPVERLAESLSDYARRLWDIVVETLGSSLGEILAITITDLFVLLLCCALAKRVCCVALRPEGMGRSFLRDAAEIALEGAGALVFFVLIAFLFGVWPYSVALMFVVYFALKGIAALVRLKVVRARRVPIGRLFRLRNLLAVEGMYLLEMLLIAAAGLLLVAAFGAAVALLLIAPVTVYLSSAVETACFASVVLPPAPKRRKKEKDAA